MKPSTRVIEMLIELRSELGMNESQVELLRAMHAAKSDAELCRMTGKTTASLDAHRLCRSIKNNVRRMSAATQDGKHPVQWTGLPVVVVNRVKSMFNGNRIVYWEDVVDNAHMLPSVRNLGPGIYNQIRSLAQSTAGLEMPTWEEVIHQ